MKSAVFNLSAQRFALMWAKEHLPTEEYTEIKKSYDFLIKRTVAFVVICCIPVIIAFMFLAFNAPFSKSMENAAIPEGATEYVMAKVDYDGNFYWTHDSKKYEYALKDYGLSSENYEFGDKVKVYINDAQDIIKVTADGNYSNIRNIEVGVGVIGSILIPVLLILCVYMPIAYRTFGKRWIEFYKDF
ncbi:MAG TPA: hypothetical protein IAC31_04545 [Candidatus Faecousia intestinigallinarum]|nr:hypothetical protein [Candidatus Faecousia intestinigallinarum]